MARFMRLSQQGIGWAAGRGLAEAVAKPGLLHDPVGCMPREDFVIDREVLVAVGTVPYLMVPVALPDKLALVCE
jgi:hypothetical protein